MCRRHTGRRSAATPRNGAIYEAIRVLVVSLEFLVVISRIFAGPLSVQTRESRAMNQSNLILYVILAGIAAFAAFANVRKTNASRRAVLAHVLLITIMVFEHTSAINNLRFLLKVFCCDGIPQWSQQLHLAASILAPDSTMVTWLVVDILRFLFWISVLLGLCFRARAAREAVLRLLPLVFVSDALGSYFSGLPDIPPALAGSLSHRLIALLIWQGLFVVVLGWTYVWMFLFYRSKASDPLFASESRG